MSPKQEEANYRRIPIFHRICKANFRWFSLHLWLAEYLYKLTTIRGINDSTACAWACFLSDLCCIGKRSRICAKTFRPRAFGDRSIYVTIACGGEMMRNFHAMRPGAFELDRGP